MLWPSTLSDHLQPEDFTIGVVVQDAFSKNTWHCCRSLQTLPHRVKSRLVNAAEDSSIERRNSCDIKVCISDMWRLGTACLDYEIWCRHRDRQTTPKPKPNRPVQIRTCPRSRPGAKLGPAKPNNTLLHGHRKKSPVEPSRTPDSEDNGREETLPIVSNISLRSAVSGIACLMFGTAQSEFRP